MKRRFIQCDVFTSVPTCGNGLAVVLDGEGLSDEAMQRFAAWTQLAETTFLQPPTDPAAADYRVRIFTTTRELPFAGHPTLGSCAAWAYAGGAPARPGLVRQECAIGIVEVDLGGDVPAFVAPETRITELGKDRVAEIVRVLHLDPRDVVGSAYLVNGPEWEVLELRSAAAVLAADPSGAHFPHERAIGLIGPHEAGAETDFEVRMIDVWHGVKEDPITGSLNAAIARWRQATGRLDKPYTVTQGSVIGRIGRVHVRPAAGGRVMIGGETIILVEGTLEL
ncbi:PhzF family phenazine biosynthesis protein [Aureimonas pseudogalii]|uniref:PhzF family phenazine biosynthesis protein n=1 Tax=Aureimonas pseudogalii TaxID=1744844 RepID=A0A7W6H2X1_9HYPH|nr:PhzF family phenazine biosynthesis protein [Aureimonas pseudogalii]MBB3996258.1 PhzF family phenazine biosynthesis protein [Aureimonas pseudogalii]